ncbi:MAG: AAA family ATPase, partial [Candidatus Omnitrophica bacterium]|nr:AAA family ATPase [Candidatus Omnitrophota bacterium]
GLEVDFVLGMGEVALEIKGSGHVDKRDIHGLDAFTEACSPKKSILVCNEKEKRLHGKITILPWEAFLRELWAGKVL